MDHKDRFGSTLRQREQAEENLYFARVEQALREQHARAAVTPAAAEEASLPPPRCPHCHVALNAVQVRELPLFECGVCGSAWVDRGVSQPFPAPPKPQWIGMLADYYGRA